MSVFKPEHIGQQVSDPRFGNGVIVSIDPNAQIYPVKVKFDGMLEGLGAYTADGAYTESQLPTLQFGPLDNWQRRTQPQLQDGQIIEVELTSGYWRLARVHIIDGLAFMSYDCRPDGSVIKYLLNHNWRCVQ